MTTNNISTGKLALALAATLPLIPLSYVCGSPSWVRFRTAWAHSACVCAIRVLGIRDRSPVLAQFMAEHGE